MNNKWWRGAALTVALSAVAVSPTFAQTGLEVTGYGGAYVPLTDLVQVEEVQAEFTQKTGFVVGGRLNFPFSGPLGLEGGVLYALSEGESSAGGVVTAEDAYVWAASGRLALRIGIPLAPVAVMANGGVAVIGRGGDAYEGADGTTDVGGVVGAGVLIDLSPKLALRGDVETYLYSAELEDPEDPLGAASEFQADLVVSAGLSLSL